MILRYLLLAAVFILPAEYALCQNQDPGTRPKIGLVLSGGGAKGLAHIGVIRAMEKAGLTPDYITGTSMGSIVGALYAIGYTADDIEDIVRDVDWDAILSNEIPLNQITYEEKSYYGRYIAELPVKGIKVGLPRGLIEGQKLSERLSRITRPAHDIENFHNLPIPFACVATDIATGEPVVLNHGSLPEALRASMAIPTFFTPVEIDSNLYVDGGVVRNFPVQEAKSMGADIVIGTDPDCDRLGIAVRDTTGKLVLLNGNQTFAILVNALLKDWSAQGKIDGKQFVGSTIVSTPMIIKLAESYGVKTKVGLTGFKWIAKMIREAEGEEEFIGGGEESFGFMVGDFVRDKDAVSSTVLACEIAARAKSENSTLYKELLELYLKHGFYKEHLISVVKKGVEGAQEIKQMMTDMRNNPVHEIHGEPVKYLFDYESSICKDLITGEEHRIDLPKSNVLIYETTEGTRMAARPSGTEPKIKFYFSVNGPMSSLDEAKEAESRLDQKIRDIIKEFNL